MTVIQSTSRWWHVGDDLATDVAAAARLGLRTCFFFFFGWAMMTDERF